MNKDPSLDKPVTTKSITDVVRWTKEVKDSRLFLPPIQRSVVWRNSQIINYWDSLLRGYPAGLMLVHHPKEGAHQARTTNGDTREINAQDFQLFDGQQRLTVILLSLGEGQLQHRLKLWVDLAADPKHDSDLRFVLRISSTGQPFGYTPDAPNEKFPLEIRRKKSKAWMDTNKLDRFDSAHAFGEVSGSDLIDAHCVVPFHELITIVQTRGEAQAAQELQARHPEAQAHRLAELVKAIGSALRLPILFQLIPPAVISDEAEYIRFFGRLGQGGTALTNDELTYSIIKHHFPEVHDSMKKITEGPAGRMASEVNLVLAALRVANVLAVEKKTDDWKIYVRPQPAFVSSLKDEKSSVRTEFQHLISSATGGRLKALLESLRLRLAYHEETNPYGLPAILLARLPHALLDVLLLMETQRQAQDKSTYSLPSFVLYWLLFVADSDKAANVIFKRFCLKEEDLQLKPGQKLIRHFEEQGISRPLPEFKLLEAVRDEIKRGTHRLRNWEERFAVLDASKERRMGDSLRMLSRNGELIRCVLLWLQRKYLSQQYPNYDPTSSRDEDLPIDLDHLIPDKKFGFHWKSKVTGITFEDADENFRNMRGLVGHSLGNFRWLDASDNRSRQADRIEADDAERDYIEEVAKWNLLIENKTPWTEADVAEFQTRIDLRTVAIYETLLGEGGLSAFTTISDQT